MWDAFSVAVDGGTIAADSRGEGTPLILIHGFGGSRRGWDPLAAQLPADTPIIRIDMRGFGQSTQDEAVEFSHADDLLAVLDARGVERAVIAGLSAGGGVAAHFAIEHPDRVERLVLMAPALQGWEWSQDWRDRWVGCIKAARSGDIDSARDLWWRHPLFDPVRQTAMAALVEEEIMAFSGRQWVRDPQRRVLPDIERLHAITAPTLLLIGDLDLPDFRLAADVITASVPVLARIDYPATGHMLPLERPADVAAAIAGFIAA